MGSKNRIAKYLLPIILKDRKEGQWYVEPFCGGLNMIDKVEGNRIGADKNEFLIEMWKGLQENRERPYKIEKELYNKARDSYNKKDYSLFDKFMIGWIGWMGSYNGRFFDGGYSGHSVGKRDYISEQIKNTEAQIENIKNIEFVISSYVDLKIPENSIIYCDIPYKDTKQYITSKDFDHTKFWDWCRKMSEKNLVFVSEYKAPNDFICVWEKKL
jgi:DNA adenine methylase